MAFLLRRSSRSLCPSRRAFSTSRPALVNLQWEKNHPDALADAVPPYPYGPTRLYKQSRKGLYGGQRLQFGNNVSGDFEIKTRRQWHPNIKTKRLFSKALNRYVQVRVSTRVLRTIDKLGGLDEYLLGEKETRIRELGESGWWLRWAIMQTPGVKKQFAAEREALGLPALSEELAVEEEDLEAAVDASAADAEVAEVTAAQDADLEADPAAETGHVDEVLAEDDAFQVEQDASLPPLKFRVGPRQHIMLTERGWRRTKPYDTRDEAFKQRIKKQHARRFMQLRMEELDKQLEVATIDEEVAKVIEPIPATGLETEEGKAPRAETVEDATVGQAPLTTNPSTVNPALEAEAEIETPAPREPEIEYELQTRPLTQEERVQITVVARKQFEQELDLEVEARFAKEMAKRQARRAMGKEQRKEKRKAEREMKPDEVEAVA